MRFFRFLTSKKETKAFTLVEVLMVTALTGLLGIIAISMYFNLNRSVGFIASFRSMQSVFRQARDYAAFNSSKTSITEASRYAIKISENEKFYFIEMFVDSAEPEYYLDSNDQQLTNKGYKFSKQIYSISVEAQNLEDPLDLPIAFFYDSYGTSFSGFYTAVTGYEMEEAIERSAKNYISILFEDPEEGLKEYLVINQVSGLSEDYYSLTEN